MSAFISQEPLSEIQEFRNGHWYIVKLGDVTVIDRRKRATVHRGHNDGGCVCHVPEKHMLSTE